MIIEYNVLSILIGLPFLGAVLIALFVRGDQETTLKNTRNTALWVSLGTFLFSLLLVFSFDRNTSSFQFVEKYNWIEGYNIYYYLGIDGISLFFILLTTLLVPICILVSWNSITTRIKEYMIAFLCMESLVIGVFCALDMVLFYLFFEAVLIPMFLIIGIWGGERKIYASLKFFLYTLAGSVLLLVALLYLYNSFGTTSIPDLMELVPTLDIVVQRWLWLALFASFAVKVPMWPVHTWLPDAHVQAPTAGSVILAGILLKLGGYGFLRLSLPMLPLASEYFDILMFVLSIIAIVYTSLVALMQDDMKKLIAYSSVAHMGFVTLGIFAFNHQGVEGAIFVMLSHGLVSAALFMCVGVLYDRLHTKAIDSYGGVTSRMPRFALIFLTFTMASVGLPGTSGFVGELLTMAGTYQVNKWVAAISATGVILGAAYMLWLYKRVMFGKIVHDTVRKMQDLSLRETCMFVPLLVLVLVLGVYPSLITDYTQVSVKHLVNQVKGNKVQSQELLEKKEIIVNTPESNVTGEEQNESTSSFDDVIENSN